MNLIRGVDGVVYLIDGEGVRVIVDGEDVRVIVGINYEWRERNRRE